MITQEQYEEAKQVVSKYGDQLYAISLIQAKKDFPIGCKATCPTGWTIGTVYGYGRIQNKVTIKVRKRNGCAGHFLAKNAQKQ